MKHKGNSIGIFVLAGAALSLGMRREDSGSGGCGPGPLDPRGVTVTYQNSGISRALELHANRTTDVPLYNDATPELIAAPAAQHDPTIAISYYGDSNSILYLFDDYAPRSDARIVPYLAVGGLNTPINALELNLAQWGLPQGARVARQYDRGECSLVTQWSAFFPQIHERIDAEFAKLTSGNPIIVTRTRTEGEPLLDLSRHWDAYPGDTGDRVRFHTIYHVDVIPGFINDFDVDILFDGSFHVLGHATGDTYKSVAFTLDNVRVITGTTELANTVKVALYELVPTAVVDEVNNLMYTPVPSTTCTLRANSYDARVAADRECLNAVRTLFPALTNDPETNAYASNKVRCKLPDNPSIGAEGQCEFQFPATRTQVYPEGFEFVLSEKYDDAGYRLLSSAMSSPDGPDLRARFCSPSRFPRNPADSSEVRVGQWTPYVIP